MGKFREDKPKDCKYCYFWGGKQVGCEIGGEEKCYYRIIPEYKKKGKCYECPYGKKPCIGWCTKDLIKEGRKGAVTLRFLQIAEILHELTLPQGNTELPSVPR